MFRCRAMNVFLLSVRVRFACAIVVNFTFLRVFLSMAKNAVHNNLKIHV